MVCAQQSLKFAVQTRVALNKYPVSVQTHLQQEKENVIDNYKENYLLSPYSYNSFLSELYTVSSSNEQLHV